VKIYPLVFTAMLFGCAGGNPNQYKQVTEATNQSNRQAIELQIHYVEELVRLEQAKIAADKEIALAEIKARGEEESKGTWKSSVWSDGVVDIDAYHCDRYQNYGDNGQRFTQCLQDEILSFQSKRKSYPTGEVQDQPASVSGDHNIVIVGSAGAEVNQGKVEQETTGGVSAALIGMMNKSPISPLPPYQEQLHPVAQGIREAKGLVSELAPPALKMVLGWKGIDALGDALKKDSTAINGGIVSNSNNPITTRITTSHASAE
jgi:hypothetical protein